MSEWATEEAGGSKGNISENRVRTILSCEHALVDLRVGGDYKKGRGNQTDLESKRSE